MSGRLSVSKVEVVLKLVSGLTEQPVAQVVELARYLTVKQLRWLVRGLLGRNSRTGNSQHEEAESPRSWVTLKRQVAPVDLMAFEYVLKLISGVSNLPDGDTSRAQAVEYVLAEGMTTLMRFAELDLPSLEPVEGGDEKCDAPTSPNAASRPASGFVVKPAAAPDAEPGLETDFVWPTEMDELDQIDAQLASLSQTLAKRDLDIGALGERGRAAGLHVEAGYDNFDDYCRVVLQFPPASMASRVALAHRLWGLEPIESALVDGRIGFEAASLLARVSQKADAGEWVERATRLTVKQLREEVETARLFGRVSDAAPRPPSPGEMRDAEDFERAVYSTLIGRMRPESQTSGEGGASEHQVHEDVEVRRSSSRSSDASGRESQMSGDPQVDPHVDSQVDTIPLRLSLPVEIATFWRELEAEHREHLGGDFVPFLIRAVLENWQDTFSHLSKIEYSDVYQRDRWKCQNPRCTSRHVTPHHIIRRSAGGGEERSNLVSLCAMCHLELVHGQTARGPTLHVSGLAPDELRWGMGSTFLERGHGSR